MLFLKDFDSTGTNVFDTEGFSNYLMSIGSVRMSLIFTETEKGVKISLRSKGDISANELAKEFGGGGHRNAAGTFIINPSMDELINRVITAAKKYIK